MMLSLVSEKLVQLCDEIVEKYLLLTDSKGTVGRTPSVAGSSNPDTFDRQGISFGNYEIDDCEWEAIVKILISMQLNDLERLLTSVMKVSLLAQRKTQMSKLLAADSRVKTIAGKLRGDHG
jgi:hypothetical protein